MCYVNEELVGNDKKGVCTKLWVNSGGGVQFSLVKATDRNERLKDANLCVKQRKCHKIHGKRCETKQDICIPRNAYTKYKIIKK